MNRYCSRTPGHDGPCAARRIPKSPRWLGVVIVLAVSLAALLDACERAADALRSTPRSLRILLAWIVASVCLIVLLAYTYRIAFHEGVEYGKLRMLEHLHPARAALDGRHFVWPRGATLDANRLRIIRRPEAQL